MRSKEFNLHHISTCHFEVVGLPQVNQLQGVNALKKLLLYLIKIQSPKLHLTIFLKIFLVLYKPGIRLRKVNRGTKSQWVFSEYLQIMLFSSGGSLQAVLPIYNSTFQALHSAENSFITTFAFCPKPHSAWCIFGHFECMLQSKETNEENIINTSSSVKEQRFSQLHKTFRKREQPVKV